MTLSVVVGGQLGSEGKGKLVSYLACSSPSPVAVVRTAGPNAGHTASAPGGRSLTLRQLPSGTIDPRAQLYLAAGMIIDLPLLLSEIALAKVTPSRLLIDPAASLLDESDRQTENTTGLQSRLGSTLSGTGSATARKILRQPDLLLAGDVPKLLPYLGNVSERLNAEIDAGTHVVVEGTQGFGLSLHHSGVYPFTTSRDTTAAAFLSEAGLSPLLVTDIFVVLRTYPIRVAGNSGPLAHEIDWPTVTKMSGYPKPLAEFTTVTKRLRRVARFDFEMAHRAVRLNRPTGIALHGLDYIDYRDLGKTAYSKLTAASQSFVETLEESLNVPACFLFTGPAAEHIIDRR